MREGLRFFFFGRGGGRITWFSGRTEGGSVVVNGVQREVYEKTDCQHTANGGRGEHCRALRGESDKFFRDTGKILQTPPPLEGINNDRFLIITRVSIILSIANSLAKLISNLT